MNYINIQNGVQLRDQGGNGKGHLHAVIGISRDGVLVEQSRNHGQIIQRVLCPNGKLVITYFAEMPDRKIKELNETTIYLWENTEGKQK